MLNSMLTYDSSATWGLYLAQKEDQIRQSDVTFWGIIALVLGVIAVFGANISALFPTNFTTGLHSPRLEGGNLSLLRAQVADLQDESFRIRNENSRLATMLKLAEQDQGEVTRRVGAIESTLPIIMESVPPGTTIDSSVITSAIGEPDDRQLLPAEGGSVAVTQIPIDGVKESVTAIIEDSIEMPVMPQAQPNIPVRIVSPTPLAFGIALGPEVTVLDAFVAWKDITNKVGPLLLGLGPVLSGNAGLEQQRLIAGPIDDYAHAEQLCARMIRVGISCLPVPYAGRSLPN